MKQSHRIVPENPDEKMMFAIYHGENPLASFNDAIAAAPPYEITEAEVEAAVVVWVKTRGEVKDGMRAALESFVRRLGEG